MANKKHKLELTWIGKDKELKLEPRILIEDPSKSYGDKSSENMLIHGDNLLALKALEQDFAGRIKCIYIDPPYNTGSRIDAAGKEIGYEDGLEHSEWLNLMRPRLEILKNLLISDGVIFVQIDDKEQAYLKALMDEVFNRQNFLNMIVVKTSDPSGHKTVNPSPYSQTEYLLMYAKDRRQYRYEIHYVAAQYDQMYGRIVKNIDAPFEEWQVENLASFLSSELGYESVKEAKKDLGNLDFEQKTADYALKNSARVFQPTAISNDAGRAIIEKRNESIENQGKVYRIQRDGYEDIYILNGRQMYFYSSKVKIIDGETVPAKPLTNLWLDIPWNGIAAEGGIQFKNGKKPEKLIKRCIEISTKAGDYVLDSFLGSGTTAAVAQKINRKWIGVELGEHINTHCIPRLRSVIDGTDQSGISKAINWKGGGGFKFYNLAPSLLHKDSFGNFVIDEKYNANMLAAAMCKQEGFKFNPDKALYWNHGKSTETDFIFVTTGFVTAEQLDKIHSEMKAGESLLICAKAYAPECESQFANITIKKIPQMILGKCEFGKDNYDLNIIKVTEAETEESNEA